jgi:hypothetical protein
MQFGTMQTTFEGDIFFGKNNVVTSATCAKVSIQLAGAVTERGKK